MKNSCYYSFLLPGVKKVILYSVVGNKITKDVCLYIQVKN